MKEEREAFSRRLAEAMRDADYEPRPSVLFKLFNSRYRGESVSFQSVSRWLRGRSIPEQDKLQLLARLLGAEPHVLRFGGSSSKVAEPRADWRSEFRPQDREAIEAYLSLSAAQRKLVRDLLFALK
jgi:transcriptional regulator with XRE-family HTH domain